MLVVDRARVGDVAFARLEREGVVRAVFGAWSLPADVPDGRALRAHLLAPLVPAHTWITGLAALWLEGFAGPPVVIDLVAARGAHRSVPRPGSPPLMFHTGSLWGLAPGPGGPRATTATRACVDALAHSAPSAAIPATASALRTGATSVAQLREAVAALDRRITYRARLASLVEALGTL